MFDKNINNNSSLKLGEFDKDSIFLSFKENNINLKEEDFGSISSVINLGNNIDNDIVSILLQELGYSFDKEQIEMIESGISAYLNQIKENPDSIEKEETDHKVKKDKKNPYYGSNVTGYTERITTPTGAPVPQEKILSETENLWSNLIREIENYDDENVILSDEEKQLVDESLIKFVYSFDVSEEDPSKLELPWMYEEGDYLQTMKISDAFLLNWLSLPTNGNYVNSYVEDNLSNLSSDFDILNVIYQGFLKKLNEYANNMFNNFINKGLLIKEE